MEKVVIVKDSTKGFYKKIYYYRLLSFFRIKFVLKTKNIKKEEKTTIENIINILNANSRREKYNLIYDYACDYLDNEFQSKKLCGFKNDMCICNRNKRKEIRVSSCCERVKTREICEHFDNKRKTCSIKSLGCKLFICPYLKKRGIKYPIREIPYLKYFLSIRQKAICITSIFQDKDVTVDKFLKPYKMP